ncbi:MAG: glycosyltransferase [Muribaculaceae bacterium]
MMYFSFILSPLVYALLGLSLCLIALIVVWYARRYCALRRCAMRCCNSEAGPHEGLAAATVVVYAHNDGAYLERFLPYLLNQNYPEYEVIVVNDSSVDNTAEVISNMLTRYDNLRQTFIPEGSRNVSRRKLAIMLGVKAARHELIVVTNANCCPPGPDWLMLMCRNFTPETDVVIGYSRPRYKKDRRFGRNYRVYDNVTDSVQYLSSDINGYPFRGTNDNLAYRRGTFFANNGFHRSLMLHYGDDDIFVNEIANAENTRVELCPDAIVTAYFDNYSQIHSELKLRHDFTAKRLRRWPFITSSIISFCQYANVAALAAAVALDYRNIFTVALAAMLLLALWITLICLFRGNARRLKAPRLHLGVPFYTYLRPIVNALYALRGYRMRESNFTWQRLK